MKTAFKTAYEIFEHSVIRTGKGYDGLSIYVKCPRCGKIGRLIRANKNLLGTRYRVVHKGQYCTFGVNSEEHSFLEEIYNKYRRREETKIDEDAELDKLKETVLREIVKHRRR